MKVEVAVLGSLVPNSPPGLSGRKAALNLLSVRAQRLCESRGGRAGLPTSLLSQHGLCGRTVTLTSNRSHSGDGARGI